ncbi:hypothetical protein A3Q56_03718 [Intoshia linei]|uniref:Uncharacterized protein n=1 Tax=Intoshia linei TaxID=1819745 RepID=A0A177B2T5_9BILA|nr:hypothetical protein A3Q56_03718 [Intoshia linei]
MNKKAADDFKSIANSSMLDSNSVYLPVNGIENLTDTKVAKKANLTFSLKRKPVKIDKINKIAWDNFNYTDKQHGAAKIIQAAWRGYFTRKQNGQVLKFRNYQKQKRIFDYINYLCSAIKKYTDLYNRERKMRILQTHAIKKLWTQVAKLKLWRQQVDESKKNCSDGAIPIDTQSDFSCSKTMDSDLLKNSQTITNLNDNHKFLEIKVSELEKKFFKLEQLHNVKLNFTDHDGTDKNYIKCIELKIQEYGFLDNYIILSWTKEPSQDSFSQFIIYVNKVKHTTLPSSQCCAIVYINDEDYYTFSVSLFVDNVEVNNSNLVNFKKSHVLNQGLNTLDAENTSSDVMSLGYNQPIVLSESESSVNSRETKMKQKSLSNVSIREFNSSSVSDTAIYRINSKPKIDRLRTHSERCIESLQPISCTRKPTLLFKKQSTLKNKHKMETRNPISKSPRYIDFKRKFTREIKF